MTKQLGALYLILGTCVAAGMLGLPVVTAEYHFVLTAVLILSAWVLMTAGAWCLLKVNLRLPSGTNLISMVNLTLGPVFKWMTWVAYLMLLYTLICAYLSASSDLLQHFLLALHLPVSRGLATVLALLLLGGIVYRGIHMVDWTNRFLMSIKLFVCLLLMWAVAPHSHMDLLLQGQSHWHFSSWLVVITAFGYAIILPSIRDYLGSNQRQLFRVMWIGSFIPVVLYLAWIGLIQGAIPRAGPQGLIAMSTSAHTNTLLMQALAVVTHHAFVKTLSVVFISICSLTGFMGVSLCLFDFLRDGLRDLSFQPRQWGLAIATFLPPLLVVLLYPAVFVQALAFAGLLCLYILVFLPVLMYFSLFFAK